MASRHRLAVCFLGILFRKRIGPSRRRCLGAWRKPVSRFLPARCAGIGSLPRGLRESRFPRIRGLKALRLPKGCWWSRNCGRKSRASFPPSSLPLAKTSTQNLAHERQTKARLERTGLSVPFPARCVASDRSHQFPPSPPTLLPFTPRHRRRDALQCYPCAETHKCLPEPQLSHSHTTRKPTSLEE